MANENVIDINRKAYNAFTGCDMIAHINTKPIGILGAVTLSITREVVPIYTAGSPNPRCFVKGRRGIAGSLVFGTFDKHAITQDIFAEEFGQADSRKKAIEKYTEGMATLLGKDVKNFPAQTVSVDDISRLTVKGAVGGQTQQLQNRKEMLDAHIAYLYSTPIKFSDEVPPFNITITFVNENGAASTMSIYGVQLINETQAFTMEDMTNDLAVTYVARDIDPLMNLTSATFTS